ncbi:MAG: EAL domain-containing protein [Pseudomonadota bacterium]
MNPVKRAKVLFFSRPQPEDVQSILSSTPLSMYIMIYLAIVCTPIASVAMHATFAWNWLSVTLALCLYVLFRARKNQVENITHVSKRLMRRLLFYQFLLAMPFSVLGFMMMAYGKQPDASHIAWAYAGMATGGATLLRRVFAAACVYGGTMAVFAIAGLALSGGAWSLFLASTIVIYLTFLLALSAYMGDTERERDRSVEKLSAAVRDLEKARDDNNRLANVDTITGLANRKAFTGFLEDATKDYKANRTPFALLLLDLDRFKNVNDTFGHSVGDKLINEIGQRLHGYFEGTGTVGRLGGDEFAVLVPGISYIEDLMPITEGLLTCVKAPAKIDGRSLHPGTSVGIALCPQHGATPSDLMLAADVALNRVKDIERGTSLIFDEDLKAELLRADAIEAGLRNAIRMDGLSIRYQPQVELATGRYLGAEALARWDDPELGSVSPADFLNTAAERGLVPRLSRYIIAQIGQDILEWRRAGIDFGRIALNVHPVELKSPDVLLRNIENLERQGVMPNDLVIEVTEGCFVGRGNDAAKMFLDTLEERGYEISLDDFGTGHASLSHLRGLPVKELKIDRSFVARLTNHSDDMAIVAGTTEIARGLQIRCVAEGVETPRQRDILEAIGIEIGQGFLWSMPLTASDLASYVQRRPTPKAG